MHILSIMILVLITLLTGVLGNSCSDWANSVTRRWRSYFLQENDFPAYETWDQINLSSPDLEPFPQPFATPVPDKFRRPPASDGIGEALKGVKDEVSAYKVEMQERLDEMRGLVKESLDEGACGMLWRMYEDAESGRMKDRMAAMFLEKCKTSLGRQNEKKYL